MSGTRHMKDRSNLDDGWERHMSHPKVVGFNVSLRRIGIAAPERSREQIRDAVWFFNYARLMQRPAESLSREMGMSRQDINFALTDPDCPPDTLDRFTAAIVPIREKFLASRRPLHETTVTKVVRTAVRKARRGGVFSTVIGPYRIGKTLPFRDEFFRHYMDRAIFIDARAGNDMTSFCADFAAAMGIGGAANKKCGEYQSQILGTLATGVIEMIFFDEGQFLWPMRAPRAKADPFPERISFLRHCYDKARFFRDAQGGQGGLSFAICATPQFRDQLNAAISGQWAAGQFEGRQVITYTPETLDRTDIEGVARFSAPDFDTECIELVADATEASPGLLGFMENLIADVRFRAEEDELPVTASIVKKAAREMLKGTAVESAAKAEAKKITKAPVLTLASTPDGRVLR